ncbi:MAG: hypothetical protein WAK31_08700 [Chthoniobacterales bacterium]
MAVKSFVKKLVGPACAPSQVSASAYSPSVDAGAAPGAELALALADFLRQHQDVKKMLQ